MRYTRRSSFNDANPVQYENSLKIYELRNISPPKGSFASTPISILGLLNIYNVRANLGCFLFIIIISLSDLYMLWFNFILGLNFIFFCFKLIIIHYHTQKQKKIKFKPRIKLNHKKYIYVKKLQSFFFHLKMRSLLPHK